MIVKIKSKYFKGTFKIDDIVLIKLLPILNKGLLIKNTIDETKDLYKK